MLAGGVGAARFLEGLIGLVSRRNWDEHLTVVGNTGDDLWLHGLRVCPDLDSVMYTIGGGGDRSRGWGRATESFRVMAELRAYDARPDWFGLGDLDLATHLVRTEMLRAGRPLSDVTRDLCSRWELPLRLLPMTNDFVETHVVIQEPGQAQPRTIHFQEWWVRHQAKIPALEFVFVGAADAAPGADVLTAISSADLIVLPPSNPVVSIGPILSVPGIREALVGARAPIVGVSPIIGSAPVRGMADACLRTVGAEVSAAGVAGHFGNRGEGGLLDGWVIDQRDEASLDAIRGLGIDCVAVNTLMTDPQAARGLAAAVLTLGGVS